MQEGQREEADARGVSPAEGGPLPTGLENQRSRSVDVLLLTDRANLIISNQKIV